MNTFAHQDLRSKGTDTVGELLRSTRESLGLTIRDMADITRIQPAWLQCLEGGRYNEMPAEVFIRGFLRSYARELRLDEQQVLDLYLRETRQDLPVSVATEAQQDPAERRLAVSRFNAPRRFGRLAYAAAVAVVVMVATLAVLALSGEAEQDSAASNFRVQDNADVWLPGVENTTDWRR